jgi:dolichol-phosphate mannosyltransferase
MDLRHKLCLILPTLNERENILPQINEVFKFLPEIGQIFIVDDNSTDGTTEIVEQTHKDLIKNGKIRILKRTKDLGLTSSLREAIALCPFEYIGWMDCDLSMPTNIINDLLSKLEKGYDICVASRFLSGGNQKKWWVSSQDSKIEIFLSTMLNRFLVKILKLPITDFTSGFVISKKEILNKIEWRGKHGEYFLDFIYQANILGAKITEVPYSCGTRKFGKSKTSGNFRSLVINSFRYFKSVISVILRNRKQRLQLA